MKELVLTLMICILVSSSVVGYFNVAQASLKVQSTSFEPWPMFRHDLSHSGFSASTAPGDNKTTGGIIWTYSTYGEVHSSAAVVNDVVFIGSDDKNIYALNATTGEKVWNKTLGTNIVHYVRSSPAVADGIIFLGSFDKSVYALNRTNGNTIWSSPTKGSISSSPVVADSVVLIGSSDGNLYAFDKSSGYQTWNATLGGGVSSSPAIANNTVYIGSLNGTVYALNVTSGTVIHKYITGGQIISSPTVANNMVFVGSNDHQLYAFDASTLSKIWAYSTGNAISSSPAIDGDIVFVGSEDHTIYAIRATREGYTSMWNKTTGDKVRSSPTVADGKVFVGSDDGKLYALNKTTGVVLWTYQTNGQIDSSPTVAEGKIFVGSKDHSIFAFGPNEPPTASFTSEPIQAPLIEHGTAKFNASSSSDPDFNDHIVQYAWDFGDGNKTATNNAIMYHQYMEFGNYNVTLVVTDSHQATSTPHSSIIMVQKHDVAIVEVHPWNASVVWGEIINVDVTVKNEGNFTESNVTVTAYADISLPLRDEIVIANRNWIVPSLEPGAISVLTIPWNTSGTQRSNYEISARAWPVPSEYNTANNELPDDFIVVNLHDVAVTDVSAQPTVVLQGGIIHINVTVENMGDFAENVTVFGYANNETITSYSMVPIEPGKNMVVTLLWNTTDAAASDYTLSANATIPEDQDISNNYKADGVVIVTTPKHDVKVSGVVPSTNIVWWPDSIDINVTVLNQGSYSESNITVIAYAIRIVTGDRITIGTQTISYLPSAHQLTRMFTWSTQGIPYEELPALYGISANATIAKDDDPVNNYLYYGEISIRAPIHDIAVTEVMPSRISVIRGKPINITVTVENQGAYLEVGVNVTAYAGDDVIIGHEVIDSLVSLGSKIIVIQWTTDVSPGNYTISANATISQDDNLPNNFRLSDRIVSVFPPTIHDIAANNIQPMKTVLCKDKYTADIKVTIANEGHFGETFSVSLNATGFMRGRNYFIGVKNVTLDSEAQVTLYFTWNSSGVEKDLYGFVAKAGPVAGEYDTADNVLRSPYTFHITMEGDVTADGKVDIKDIAPIAKYFGYNVPPAPGNCDINNDRKIDIRDVAIAAKQFGEIDP